MRAIKRFNVRTVLPEAISGLSQLATNLRWSWHQPTYSLFAGIDPELWEQSHQDPVELLAALSPERLHELSQDSTFVNRVGELIEDLRVYRVEPRWYQSLNESRPQSIAYFSAEFGITTVLPQYSGGLGILAGDHLKTASDLGIPIVGVGLFYQAGYFNQSLSREGWQQENYPLLDPDGLPLTLLREADGTPTQIVLALPEGHQLVAHVWVAQVGRVPLLLLDSNVPENDPSSRKVTDRLYGGSGNHRVKQEILLGIGGVRALRAWSRITGAAEPEVFHANEGHAGFLGLERIREFIAAGLTYSQALVAARTATVFTTHTPVPAGIDRFDKELITKYFGSGDLLPGVPLDEVYALGSESYDGGDESVFNMAVMGLRLAQRANGVSKLHGEVSRDMFSGLWEGFDHTEVPIGSVTNGVHAPTWVDPKIRHLIGDGSLGETARYDQETLSIWQRVKQVPDADLWKVRRELREQLVQDVRKRVQSSWLNRGASAAELGWVNDVLDPDVLTIGFARRVPTYKRLTLMLRDPERLRSILLHPERPVQIVVAGKSHPADDSGKQLIQQLVKFSDDPELRNRIVFLPNYDISMAKLLYPGTDVWLNNPLRPLEACGTSGMKAALNGGLNLSVLDGWWDELYDGENGWSIPTADDVQDQEQRDDLEAAALYDLIENQIAPRFYDLGSDGIPSRWIELIKHTLTVLGPEVDAERMVREYTLDLYTPATVSGRNAKADDFGEAREIAEWKDRLFSQWENVRIEHVESAGLGENAQVGDKITVRAYVTLGDLQPNDVTVQVLCGKTDDADEIVDFETVELSWVESYDNGSNQFAGEIELNRSGGFGYTVRVIPTHQDIAPAELGLISIA